MSIQRPPHEADVTNFSIKINFQQLHRFMAGLSPLLLEFEISNLKFAQAAGYRFNPWQKSFVNANDIRGKWEIAAPY